MRISFLLAALLCCETAFAQQSQIIVRVEDQITRARLNDAGVVLGTSSDIVFTGVPKGSGVFSFDIVNPGRYVLSVSHAGYEKVQQEILVVSARRTEVVVQLREYQNILDEVEIVSTRSHSYEPGEHSITNEKALRLPANFFDPVRVINSYPGVMTANDQNNTIVIRGNSPAGLLWRINGLDVVNPNHLANAGTFSDKPASYGGGVNIISSQLMERTDFYTGSLPARYGNALSGAIDMKLRGGDTTDYHYTAQASLIGMDLGAEGPIGKSRRTSFLVNYRYSTVGLLSNLGVKFGDEDISFQDLTFSLNSLLAHGGSLSWFGFVGSSNNNFEHKKSAEWEVDKDQYDIDYSSKNFGTGLVYSKPIKSAVNVSAGISASGSNQKRNQEASPEVDPGLTYIIYEDKFKFNKVLVSAFGRLQAKLNNYQVETGVQVNYQTDYLTTSNISQDGAFTFESKRWGTVEGMLFQPYAQWKVLISDKWNAQTAVRYVYYMYNQTGSVEPRIGMEFLPTANSSLKLTYNLVSQVQSAATYLNGNKNLELTKSHHLDLGYSYVSEKGLKLSSALYYQVLFDVPVQGDDETSYSLLNSIEVYPPAELISTGVGKNYGIELLAEKAFFDKSYFIAGASYYKSQYKGSDDIERSTRFDGGYSVNLTYGREWTKMKKQSQRTFGVSSRLMYLGGLRETPIIPVQEEIGTVYDDARAFENKLKDYFRLDLRLNWRKDKNNYTRTIAIDIQNVFNVQNEAYHYYDHLKQKVTTQYQLGLIPVLVYRIDF